MCYVSAMIDNRTTNARTSTRSEHTAGNCGCPTPDIHEEVAFQDGRECLGPVVATAREHLLNLLLASVTGASAHTTTATATLEAQSEAIKASEDHQ